MEKNEPKKNKRVLFTGLEIYSLIYKGIYIFMLGKKMKNYKEEELSN